MKLRSVVSLAASGLALALSAAVFAPVSYAQPQPSGEYHGQRSKAPQAKLQAQASIEVPQDTVRIVLAAEVAGKTQTDVSQRLNSVVNDTLAQAKSETRVTARSGAYRVWPMNDQQGRISNWRGRAEIVIESTDFSVASGLAGALSDRMPVSGLNFYLSDKERAKHEAQLLEQAADAFSQRALAVARSFGFEAYDIREVSVGGSGARFESAPRMMSMAADKSAPVPIEAGTEQVTVSVSGSVFLRSPRK